MSEADSLYFLSWLCIDPISSGNEETRDLNSAIICFLPEAKAKEAQIIKPNSNKIPAFNNKGKVDPNLALLLLLSAYFQSYFLPLSFSVSQSVDQPL